MGAHSKPEDSPAEVLKRRPVPPAVSAPPAASTPPVAPSGGRWARWRAQVQGDRRFQLWWALIAVIAIAIAAGAFVVGAQSRAEPAQPDHQAVRAAADAVTALMTFTPDDTSAQRAEVAKRLTGTLAADYAARGPDVVFPNAVASKVSMKTTVSNAAPGSAHDDLLTVLVFATQEVTVGKSQDYPTRIGIARWATVTRIGDVWRLSRVQNVSPQ